MDTITAISTPYGVGGIAVIRVSGAQAISIGEQLLGASLTRPVQFCRVPDLDDLVVTTFRAPHSFTGEDVVELSCHGSLYIQQEILRRLLALGCRMARGGEFTQRAFLNGKMDLVEAEAVADLIAAQTETEKNLALSQLRGGVSSELHMLRDELLHITSLLELELDFADHEELEFADRSELLALCDRINQHLHQLTDSFQTGQAIKNGISVAIVGPTNAGKSTLLNALLGEERAIVSPIAGTTRDTVEDTLVLDGILFRLIDTAGLRTTTDTIEQLGIERSRRAMSRAQIIIDLGHEAEGSHVIRVHNKADLDTTPLLSSLSDTESVVRISALRREIQPLREALVSMARTQLGDLSGLMISNARHYEALLRAEQAMSRVREAMELGLSGELISLDLQDGIQALGEITGQITGDEVLANIFSKFCIGK